MKQKTFWILLISVIIFIGLLLLFEFNYVESIDILGKNIKNIFTHSSFETIFLIITNIMSVTGIIIILGITIYLLRKQNTKRDIMIYISSILVCLIVTNLIKIIVRRTRPLDMLIDATGFSFPSSHSSISMVVYGFIIIFLKKYYQGTRKKIYISLCVLLILLTGFSRIYFNVHYITDVIAGFSLGLVVLSISYLIIKKLDKKELSNRKIS